jgi:hypothetical protein
MTGAAASATKERVMALLDDVVNGGNLVTGVAVGGGALVAWPLIRLVARPVAKEPHQRGTDRYRISVHSPGLTGRW